MQPVQSYAVRRVDAQCPPLFSISYNRPQPLLLLILARPPRLLTLQQLLCLHLHVLPVLAAVHGISQPASPVTVLLILLLGIMIGLVIPLFQLLALWRLGPDKGRLHLNRHLLDGARAEPALDKGLDGARFALPHGLLLDKGPDRRRADVVAVVEVVAHVELVHAQRDDEARKRRWQAFAAEEGDCEVWSGGCVRFMISSFFLFCGECGIYVWKTGNAYRKTSFKPTRKGARVAMIFCV